MNIDLKIWQVTMELRMYGKLRDGKRLQQKYVNINTGESKWIDITIIIEPE
jgi:hypothetical protein